MCVLSCFRHVQLFVTLWTVAYQDPLSIGFSRQEYWSRFFTSTGHLPDPGIKPGSAALQMDSLPSEPPWQMPVGSWRAGAVKWEVWTCPFPCSRQKMDTFPDIKGNRCHFKSFVWGANSTQGWSSVSPSRPLPQDHGSVLVPYLCWEICILFTRRILVTVVLRVAS